MTTLTLLDEIYGNENKHIRLLYAGKIIKRRVYFNHRDGLYIRLNNKKIFEYDFRYTDTITLDAAGVPTEEV